MANELAKPDFIAIAQYTRLIGDEALTVEVRAIDTAQVNEGQGVVTAFDCRVHSRYAFFLRSEWREIETRLAG